MADSVDIKVSIDDSDIKVPVTISIGDIGTVNMGTIKIREGKLSDDLADMLIEAARILRGVEHEPDTQG
jgi:hypothetical protein